MIRFRFCVHVTKRAFTPKDCGLISIAELVAASSLHSRMSDVSNMFTREARLRHGTAASQSCDLASPLIEDEPGRR